MLQDPAIAPFALWRSSQEGDPNAGIMLMILSANPNDVARARTAYVIPPARGSHRGGTRARGRAGEGARGLPGPRRRIRRRRRGRCARPRRLLSSASPADRYTAAAAFAEDGTASDRALLDPLLSDADEDVPHITTALAVLSIDARQVQTPPATRPRNSRPFMH